MDIQGTRMTRRVFLQRTGALGLLAAAQQLLPACAWMDGATKAGSSVGLQTVLSGNVIALAI